MDNRSSRKTMAIRAVVGSAMATVLIVVMSACSSSGGAPASQVAGSTAGPSGSAPLKVMVIATLSSDAFSWPEDASGAQAAAAAVNAAGGVNGHKIEILACNDQNDPNAAGNCARQAVAENVVAVASGQTNYSNIFLPVLASAHIADIGDVVFQAADLTSPVAYPFDGGTFSGFVGVGAAMARDGCKKVGVVRLETPVTLSQANLVYLGAASGHAGAGPDIAVSATQPSFAGTVQSEISGGADCITGILANAQVDALISAVKQSANPNMLVGDVIQTLPVSDLKRMGSEANGLIAVSGEYPVTSPQAAQFVDQMQKYEPSATISEAAGNTWAAVTVFAKLAAEKHAYTAQAVIDALNSASALEVPLYPHPFNFSKPNPVKQLARIFNTTVLAFKISGTDYVPMSSPTIDTAGELQAEYGG
jgi:branched-chain amino acid transport system substrate-binding protein